jgi:hypothetical protein
MKARIKRDDDDIWKLKGKRFGGTQKQLYELRDWNDKWGV